MIDGHERKGKQMATQVWSVTAQKGGVSKTTTAVNLSAALALMGKRVLLADLDPQANATVHLGVDPRNCIGKGVYEVLTKKYPIGRAIISDCRKNLSLLPSHFHLAAAEMELSSVFGREMILARKLEEIKQAFDYVIIDCPPGVGLLVANAFTASEKVLLTVQPEFFALYGVNLFTQLMDAVKAGCNPHLELGGVLITMVDGKERGQMAVHRDSVRSVTEAFGSLVYKTKVRLSTRLKEAPSFGKTIFEHAPESTGAIDYMNLAKEFCQYAGQSQEARPGYEPAQPAA